MSDAVLIYGTALDEAESVAILVVEGLGFYEVLFVRLGVVFRAHSAFVPLKLALPLPPRSDAVVDPVRSQCELAKARGAGLFGSSERPSRQHAKATRRLLRVQCKSTQQAPPTSKRAVPTSHA